MKTWTVRVLWGIAGLGLLGCAAANPRPPRHQDRLMRVNEIEVPIAGIHIGVHEQGPQVHLTAMHLCDVTREDLLERITTRGSDVSREEVADYQGVVRHAVPCRNRPASQVEISGIVETESIALGKTDEHGRLTVNLEQAIPVAVALPKSAKLTIQVQGRDYGVVDVSVLYSQREAKAYGEANRQSCEKPTSSGSCNGLQSFLSQYPDGPHSIDAAATLSSSRPIIEQLGDDESWARTVAPNCTSGTEQTLAEIHAACEPFRYYLARFPSGRHAKEAHESLEIGGVRENKILADIRRKDTMAARKEAEEQRKRCVAECRLGCSSWRFRDHAACFSGCIEARCEGDNQ